MTDGISEKGIFDWQREIQAVGFIEGGEYLDVLAVQYAGGEWVGRLRDECGSGLYEFRPQPESNATFLESLQKMSECLRGWPEGGHAVSEAWVLEGIDAKNWVKTVTGAKGTGFFTTTNRKTGEVFRHDLRRAG